MTASPSTSSPALVDTDEAIGVAVEREAEVEPRGGHRLGEALGMGRAASLVDVRPIGRREEDGDLGAERAEQLRCDLAGRAVGAVDPDAQPAERIAGDLDQVALVRGESSAVVARPSELLVRPVADRRRVIEQLLELVLLGSASPCGRR